MTGHQISLVSLSSKYFQALLLLTLQQRRPSPVSQCQLAKATGRELWCRQGPGACLLCLPGVGKAQSSQARGPREDQAVTLSLCLQRNPKNHSEAMPGLRPRGSLMADPCCLRWGVQSFGPRREGRGAQELMQTEFRWSEPGQNSSFTRWSV